MNLQSFFKPFLAIHVAVPKATTNPLLCYCWYISRIKSWAVLTINIIEPELLLYCFKISIALCLTEVFFFKENLQWSW